MENKSQRVLFHTLDELKKYKISTYDSIQYAKDLCCPECGKATEFKVHAYHVDPIILGWCETPQGFMIINECPKCGTKYRFHLNATTNEKFSYEDFLQNFSLQLFLKQKNK